MKYALVLLFVASSFQAPKAFGFGQVIQDNFLIIDAWYGAHEDSKRYAAEVEAQSEQEEAEYLELVRQDLESYEATGVMTPRLTERLREISNEKLINQSDALDELYEILEETESK